MSSNIKPDWWSRSAALISAIAAIVSILAAIYIHFDSIEAVKPFQKPIINLDDTRINAKLTSTNDVDVDFILYFKNFGKGIAEDTRIRIFTSSIDKPELLIKVVDDTIANDILPEIIFNREISFLIPSSNVNLNSNDISIKEENIPPILLLIRLDYKDKIGKTMESQTFWMGYQMGRAGPYHLSIDQRNYISNFYNKLV